MVVYLCPHPHPVADFLNRSAAAYGVDPMPHGGKCLICHGVFTDEEVADRHVWHERFSAAILSVKIKPFRAREPAS